MSTASDALAVRRAAFRDALRRGDLLTAARAAARLQARAGALDAVELLAARDARIALGHAIRDARSRRATVVRPVAAPVPILLRRPRGVRFAAAAVVAMLAIALSGWLVVPHDLVTDESGGGGAPAAASSEAATPIMPQSRGRVILVVAAAPVVAEPQATVVPEPVTVVAPSPAGSAAPTSGAGTPSGTAGPTGSGGPGAGSGGPGPGTSAAPSATPTATPPPATLPPLARGFARLSGQVVDWQTGRGIAGACVSLGPCSTVSTKTDANGRWTLDLPVGSGRLDWGLEFAKTGYGTATLSVRSRTGYIFLGQQRLTAG